MTNRSKAKGTRFESEVAAFCVANGLPVIRRALAGNKDEGDLYGIEDYVVEVKAVRAFSLAQFMDEARTEAYNAGEPCYAVVLKRPGAHVGRAYVITELDQWVGERRAAA